jgi:hypothetical protein
LGVELDGSTPHHCVSKVLYHIPMDFVAEVLDGGPASLDDDWHVVVWVFSLGFGVDADEVEVFPHAVDEFVEVPAEIASDGYVVLDLVEDVELVEGDGVDFIESVEAGDVLAVALDDIDDVVLGGVALYQDVRVVDAVLLEDGLDGLVVHLARLHHPRNRNAALVLPLEVDIGRLLVQPDAKALEFVLDDLLVAHGPGGVQHNDDQVAGSRHGDDLLAATLPVLGALDDTRQVQQLDLRPLVVEHAGNAGQRRELVCGDLREGS